MKNFAYFDPATYIADFIVDRTNLMISDPDKLDFEIIADRIPKDVFNEYLNVAADLITHHRYQDAGDVYFFLAQINIDTQELWVAQGMCYRMAANYSMALDAFLKAQALDPHDQQIYYLIVGCFKDMNLHDEGLVFINEVVHGIEKFHEFDHLLDTLSDIKELLIQSRNKRRK